MRKRTPVKFNKAVDAIIEGITNGSYSAEEIAAIAEKACRSLAESNDSINNGIKGDYYETLTADCFEDRVEEYSGWVFEYAKEN